MPIPLTRYILIKDNYCCCYLGNSPEYIVALRLIKPQIEKQLPGLNLWISCRDEFLYLLKGETNVIPLSELNEQKSNLSYIREIRNNTYDHSIFELMTQSELKIESAQSSNYSNNPRTKLCLVCPEGIPPTKSLNKNSTDELVSKVSEAGYTPIVLGSDVHQSLDTIEIRPRGVEKFGYLESAGWVIGVENEYVFLGPSKGVKTTLMKSGVGLSLFKNLFPGAEIIESV
jgi:hypothetical protein